MISLYYILDPLRWVILWLSDVCILLYTSYVLLSMLLRVEQDFRRGVGIITVKNQCHPVSCIFFCTKKYINISIL